MHIPVHAGSLTKHLAFAQVPLPEARERVYFNSPDTSQIDGVRAGILMWNLPRREPLNCLGHDSILVSVCSAIVSNTTVTDLAPFNGSWYTIIEFDSDNKMFLLLGYGTGAGTVPRDQVGIQKFWYQWQVCRTYHNVYNYADLAWRTGGEPINPSCKLINVTRVRLGLRGVGIGRNALRPS
ncbi:hypothetical protein QBC36DRAFT_197704 [Triangularia setosa]|uniref:Uncharacterized protein n=1 Tax=Triangularia setosa TaxID=2587417 RepID=A0AAN6VYL6_9PEZI|nr:hypothetical protein QBC36DRAFT_197704 [Podospora setosa]